MNDDELDRLFSDARRDLPPPSELAPLAERLNITPPNAPTSSGTSPSSILPSWRVWGTTGAALAAVIAAVFSWQSLQGPALLPVARQAPVQVADTPAIYATSDENSASQEVVEPSRGSINASSEQVHASEASPRAIPRRRISQPATPEPEPSAAPQPAPQESEVALMQRAVSALRSGNASAARTALVEHRARFPEGVLAEERSSLEVEVLIASDPEAARARLNAFRQRYPHSAHRVRLERLLSAADPESPESPR